jgi:DNA-directed RNA polymerase subunit M/transcription elongation factor TFIIS
MASQFPKIDTVADILAKVKINNEHLEKPQIDKLTKLKYENEAMLTLKDRAFLYDIIGLIEILGFEESYEFLKKEQKSINKLDIIKKAPPFKEARLQYYLNITEQIREKANEEESIIQCPRCKQRRVKVMLRQDRRADEGITSYNLCLECAHSWKS